MSEIRKFRSIDSHKLLDMYETALRKSSKSTSDAALLKIAEIRSEILCRCFEVDREVEKVEKRHILTVPEIEKLSEDQIKEKIKEVRQKAQQAEELLVLSLLHAQKLWKEFLRICDDRNYIDLLDSEKVSYFEERHPEFFKKYPVVGKYMVCRGVFSLDAFRQFLIKCKNEAMRASKVKTKKEKMQTWCELRAYYIQRAWKHMNNEEKFTNKDMNKIYNEAFEMLMEDYTTFEEDQEKANQEIAKNELLYKKDTISYIIDHLEEFEGADYQEAIEMIEILINKGKFAKTLQELKSTKKTIKAVISGYGRDPRGDAQAV